MPEQARGEGCGNEMNLGKQNAGKQYLGRPAAGSLGRRREEAAETVLRLLYPPRCPICDGLLAHRKQLCCPDCARQLPWVREPACMKCGKPVAYDGQEYCEDCQKTAHWFDRGAAAFTYTGRMRHSVYRMKKENRRDYLLFYAEAMAAALEPHLKFWRPQCLIPVPMYWKKKLRRGYNQSELLAKKISVRCGIPAKPRLVQCVRENTAQKTLGRKERQQNLLGSFRVREDLHGVHSVLLIDDVYTTGSTMDELSRVLKAAGVQRVYFLTLCTGKGKKTVCTDGNPVLY